MYKYQKVVVLLCGLWIGGGACLAAEDPILLKVVQFELLYTDEWGVLKATVAAEEMYKYKSGKVVVSGNVVVSMMEAGEEGNVSGKVTCIEADKLLYYKERKLCFLEGNVRVSNVHDQLRMVTQQLVYDLENEVVFTEVPIEIVHKKNCLKGSGLRSTKDFKQYTIYAPAGTVAESEVV